MSAKMRELMAARGMATTVTTTATKNNDKESAKVENVKGAPIIVEDGDTSTETISNIGPRNIPDEMILELRLPKSAGGTVIARLRMESYITSAENSRTGKVKKQKHALKTDAVKFDLPNGQKVWLSSIYMTQQETKKQAVIETMVED